MLLRAQRRLFADRMLVEPVVARPWGMSRMFYLRLAEDDVARALDRGDDEVLGRLAHEAAGALEGLGRHHDGAIREHFLLLRAAGLVDDDLPVDEQIHVWGAASPGFLPDGPGGTFAPSGPEHTAALIEHGLSRLLAGPAPAAGAAGVAAEVAALYRPLVDHIDEEWRRRVRRPERVREAVVR
ncbi:hypothetical protein [Pseudonocardia sp. HH130629-09]|uniref:hypothetical protein n=1 Tax=Pseudonocardia sp. HH130629-09 TaxID=1641402 RepID=UPI0007617C73|nr:hypothetical protein [Pseudonocardia sp. HH130629-09]